MEAIDGEGCFDEESYLSDSGFEELICKYKRSFHQVLKPTWLYSFDQFSM